MGSRCREVSHVAYATVALFMKHDLGAKLSIKDIKWRLRDDLLYVTKTAVKESLWFDYTRTFLREILFSLNSRSTNVEIRFRG